MKKLLVLATTALLISSVGLAHDGDKGKGKGKKSCTHTCPGKECGKKKM